MVKRKKFKFQYSKDLDSIQRDALEGYLAFASQTLCKWYKWSEDETITDKVYGDAEPSFNDAIDLPVYYKKDPTKEELTWWGVKEDVSFVAWLEKKYLSDRGYDVTNRDEIEIDSIRCHITLSQRPRGQSEIEYILTLGLMQIS